MGTWTRIAIFISWICAAFTDDLVNSETDADSLRLSKRPLLRLSKKNVFNSENEGLKTLGLIGFSNPSLTNPIFNAEDKRGHLRLSKREPIMRISRSNVDIPANLLHLTQRSLRLSKRSTDDAKRSLRLSKRSVQETLNAQAPVPEHKMVLRLSKRQMAHLLTIKREATPRDLRLSR